MSQKGSNGGSKWHNVIMKRQQLQALSKSMAPVRRFARSTLAQRMTVIVSIASLLRPANRIQSAPKGFSRARAGRAHGLDHPSKPPQRDPAGEISIAAADHPFAPLHSFLFLSGPSHHRQFF
jgi:hypothetical protein